MGVRGVLAAAVAVGGVAVLGGCGSDASVDPATISSSVADARETAGRGDGSALDDVTGELILTRQRDLLDRGLINVLMHNGSDASMRLDDIELLADFFDGEPAPDRTISLRSGRAVAIQVPYGVAVDCDADSSVAAELAFRASIDDESTPQRAEIELEGTELLDTIRAEQCTARRFEREQDTSFENTEIVDGEMVTDLVIEPSDPSAGLAVTAVSGTILVGVRAPEGWSGAELGSAPVRIPLRFVVNRCDPHALAEVTKRYGLDLAVSVDGAEPVTVAVDLGDLVDELDAIVEQCTAASAGE